MQEKREARRAPVSRVRRPKRVALIKEKKATGQGDRDPKCTGQTCSFFYFPPVGAYEVSEVGWQWMGALEKGNGLESGRAKHAGIMAHTPLEREGGQHRCNDTPSHVAWPIEGRLGCNIRLPCRLCLSSITRNRSQVT